MKRLSLDIPQRLYTAILVTWGAAVLGAVIVCGNRYRPPAEEIPPTVRQFASESDGFDALRREIAEVRAYNEELLLRIAEIEAIQ